MISPFYFFLSGLFKVQGFAVFANVVRDVAVHPTPAAHVRYFVILRSGLPRKRAGGSMTTMMIII